MNHYLALFLFIAMASLKTKRTLLSASFSRLSFLISSLFLALSLTSLALFGIREDIETANAQSPQESGNRTGDGIKIISSDDSELVFNLEFPEVQMETVVMDGRSFDQVILPGYNMAVIPGEPSLPVNSLIIALPPGTYPALELIASSFDEAAGVEVLPVSQQQLRSDPPAQPVEYPNYVPEITQSYSPDQRIYSVDAFYPSAAVELGETFWLRGNRVVQLQIHPVQINPALGVLRSFSDMTIRIRFVDDAAQEAFDPETRPDSQAYESILQGTILNYADSISWRAKRDLSITPKISPCMEGDAYRVEIEETGIYRITYAELSSLGWPSAVPTGTIRMCYEDNELDIRVIDANANGTFDASDSLVFYGKEIRTQETSTNVYWLSHKDDHIGQRMEPVVDSTGGTSTFYYTSTLRLEQDTVYYSLIPLSDDNDHWYWGSALHADPNLGSIELSLEFDLFDVASGDYDVELSALVWGFDNSTHTTYEHHRFEVEVNGDSLGSVDFSGRGVSHVYQATIKPEDLLEGLNTIVIRALEHQGNDHLILVDWIDITYRRLFSAVDGTLSIDITSTLSQDMSFVTSGFNPAIVPVGIYDVTDPEHPTQQLKTADVGEVLFNRVVSGSQAFQLAAEDSLLTPLSIIPDSVPTPLLSDSTNSADMIIITDPLFDSALNPLRSLRTSQGLEVRTVFVQDIFDEFNYGIYSTEAIKEFLTYAYSEWSGIPTYVLLVGEGSYDHRNNKGLNGSGGNLVPVYLKSGVDSNLGETAADNQYVDVDGDDLADMMLGRLPARSAEELQVMVNKILAYEAGTVTTPWRGTHFFVTDNGKLPSTGCNEDGAGDFFETVDNFLAAFFPDEHLLRRVSYAPPSCYPQPEGYYASSILEMQTGIIQQINNGSHFVVYTGHSGTKQWGHENFFNTQLVAGLANGNRTPIMLPMTCLVGYYHYPGNGPSGSDPLGDSLSEKLLKRNAGGSVASYAPTGLQVQHGHDYLLKGFYSGVFTSGYRILGQAVMSAKINLNSAIIYQDLHDTFMLLGDPAMRIEMPDELEAVLLPLTSS